MPEELQTLQHHGKIDQELRRFIDAAERLREVVRPIAQAGNTAQPAAVLRTELAALGHAHQLAFSAWSIRINRH